MPNLSRDNFYPHQWLHQHILTDENALFSSQENLLSISSNRDSGFEIFYVYF